jgi:hypothetical protein
MMDSTFLFERRLSCPFRAQDGGIQFRSCGDNERTNRGLKIATTSSWENFKH